MADLPIRIAIPWITGHWFITVTVYELSFTSCYTSVATISSRVPGSISMTGISGMV